MKQLGDLLYLLYQEPKALLGKPLTVCRGLFPGRGIALDILANLGIERLFLVILKSQIFTPSRTRN